MDVWIGDLDHFEKLVAVLRELQDEAIRVALVNADIKGQRDEFTSGYAFLDEAEREERWRTRAEIRRYGQRAPHSVAGRTRIARSSRLDRVMP